ncbi:MAG: GAF domain-containing protein [Ignavibacteria bacterium]|nr:MAG: GAF domain-containing protein [Ignavibacteria bacterium]
MTDSDSMLSTIRYNVLFESVDESLLQSILGALQEVHYEAGHVIFKEGSEGDCLFLLLSGTVKISKCTSSGGELVVGILRDGDFFGELDLIDERLRSASAVADSACALIRLPKTEFRTLRHSSPEFSSNLLRMLSLKLRAGNLTYLAREESNLEALQSQLQKVHKLVEATKIVNSTLDTDRLLELILQTATTMVQADRGTLYLVDESKNELWSKVVQGSSTIEIRLPLGKGIAGYVAVSGETLNIPDAYADRRFNPEVDRRSGYRTKTILCMPMKNKDGKVIGVFQLLNKPGGSFTEEDQEFIDALSVHAAIAVENALLAKMMVQNERLSTVGKMASTIIHDIKAPMGVLRMSAEVMKRKSTDKETGKLADEMIRQIDRFVNMTREILDFSRGVSSMNIQETEVDELIGSILSFIEKDMGKRKVKLVKEMNFKGQIRVDEDKLSRVFYNIASNAADAMPDGGHLTVRTNRDNDFLLIEFIDDGIGMPPEVREKIFEPFMTYGKSYGTGLGMSIVKKIVDDHKGKIEIESALRKGTTVRVYLPLGA